MPNTRIPQTIADFNSYLTTTTTYLNAGTSANGKRLGLTDQNMSDWANALSQWQTLYAKYEDPLQSTSVVKEQVHELIGEFRDFASPLLNIMAASPNANSDDEAMFHFKIGRAHPTHPTVPIAETVIFEAQPLGGGDIKFICRTATDESRAGKPEGADSVQLAYRIAPNNPAPPQGGEIPTPEDEGTVFELFTKAHFIKHFGQGKGVFVFARWYNTKYPALAGTWSAVKVVVVA